LRLNSLDILYKGTISNHSDVGGRKFLIEKIQDGGHGHCTDLNQNVTSAFVASRMTWRFRNPTIIIVVVPDADATIYC